MMSTSSAWGVSDRDAFWRPWQIPVGIEHTIFFLFDLISEPEPEDPEDFLEGEKLEEVEEEAKKEEEEEIEIGSEQSTIPANLERLWSFSCDLTKGLNVSSLTWNKTNPVSYQTF